jgi:hypothetical protein
MSRALLSLALTLNLASLAAAGGPREQAGPAQVSPVPALGASGAAAVSQPALPSAAQVPGASISSIPSLPASAAAPSAAAAQAASAPPQAAAAAAPPAGPPNGPNTAAAPPSGPPPGGPGRGPEEGPAPGPAGEQLNAPYTRQGEASNFFGARAPKGESAGPTALKQLEAELSALQKEQRRLDTTAARIAVGQKDAPSVEAMQAAEQARRKAAALTPRIQAKREQLKQAARAERAAYRVLKDQLSALKSAREKELAAARSAGAVGGDFKGGAAEARARSLERAQDLQARIDRKKKAIALMERDNPGLAGFRAPLVAAKNALGLAPKSDAERTLEGEIRELDAAAAQKEARAESLFKTGREHPDIGAQEEGMKWHLVAKKDRAAADAKRAELKKLRGK